MSPNISKRKHIKWGDEPAHEDTTTIVLTSSKGFYVDIRLELNPPTSPLLPRLQWGFAGTAESYSNADGSRHTTWEHFVDSKSKTPEKDAGDMWEQTDGDTLEKGEMAHPTTGKITSYEELWTDLAIEGPFESLEEEKKVCVVLKLDEPEWEAKGMIIRIGGWVHGVVRVGDKFDFRIWRYGSNDTRTWKRIDGFAKDSPLNIASVLFRVTETNFVDEGAFVEGGRAVTEDDLDRGYGWQVIEKLFID